MGNLNGDDPRDEYDDENQLTPMQQQKQNDLSEAMAKQGVSEEDFLDGVPIGAFIDESAYDE